MERQKKKTVVSLVLLFISFLLLTLSDISFTNLGYSLGQLTVKLVAWILVIGIISYLLRKKWFPLLVFSILFFIASTLNLSAKFFEKQTIQGLFGGKEQQTTDDFYKKLECERLAENIKAEVESRYTIFQEFNEVFDFIFYSPKQDTCLFVSHSEIEYYISDALTKKKLRTFKFPDEKGQYEQFISEYAGEDSLR